MRREDYEKLIERMHAAFVNQGKEGIVKARAVEDRLYQDSWQRPNYDILPKLRALSIRTLVITGDHDFITGTIAAHIAKAMPNSELVLLKDCGPSRILNVQLTCACASTRFYETQRLAKPISAASPARRAPMEDCHEESRDKRRRGNPTPPSGNRQCNRTFDCIYSWHFSVFAHLDSTDEFRYGP